MDLRLDVTSRLALPAATEIDQVDTFAVIIDGIMTILSCIFSQNPLLVQVTKIFCLKIKFLDLVRMRFAADLGGLILLRFV